MRIDGGRYVAEIEEVFETAIVEGSVVVVVAVVVIAVVVGGR